MLFLHDSGWHRFQSLQDPPALVIVPVPSFVVCFNRVTMEPVEFQDRSSPQIAKEVFEVKTSLGALSKTFVSN